VNSGTAVKSTLLSTTRVATTVPLGLAVTARPPTRLLPPVVPGVGVHVVVTNAPGSSLRPSDSNRAEMRACWLATAEGTSAGVICTRMELSHQPVSVVVTPPAMMSDAASAVAHAAVSTSTSARRAAVAAGGAATEAGRAIFVGGAESGMCGRGADVVRTWVCDAARSMRSTAALTMGPCQHDTQQNEIQLRRTTQYGKSVVDGSGCAFCVHRDGFQQFRIRQLCTKQKKTARDAINIYIINFHGTQRP